VCVCVCVCLNFTFVYRADEPLGRRSGATAGGVCRKTRVCRWSIRAQQPSSIWHFLIVLCCCMKVDLGQSSIYSAPPTQWAPLRASICATPKSILGTFAAHNGLIWDPCWACVWALDCQLWAHIWAQTMAVEQIVIVICGHCATNAWVQKIYTHATPTLIGIFGRC
jgi:hypothetical protein